MILKIVMWFSRFGKTEIENNVKKLTHKITKIQSKINRDKCWSK